MSILLHVAASPRGENSESLRLAEAFLQVYRTTHPSTVIDTLSLWTEPLPVFDGNKAGAKMTVVGGGTPVGAEATAWEAITEVFDRFNAADHYLFSVPMWNGGIPYVLKHYIDVITQPGLIFGFDPSTGYQGLLSGKKAAVIYTSGVYFPGADHAFGSDFHSTYFDDWLRFCGITDITEIRFQPSLLTSDVEGSREVALAQAREVAATFQTPSQRRTA
jgi:FMN-dependent NADH-azoreductase